MARGRYLSFEEARKQNRLGRFCKEHPRCHVVGFAVRATEVVPRSTADWALNPGLAPGVRSQGVGLGDPRPYRLPPAVSALAPPRVCSCSLFNSVISAAIRSSPSKCFTKYSARNQNQ